MSEPARTLSSLDLDDDGLLKDPSRWNEAVAQEIARLNDVGPLTDDHWEVIHALREYHGKYGVAPAMSQVCRQHDRDRNWVHDLFHTCLNAWRVAGLPNPGEEAKSYLSSAY
jgi:tRNA 2-thiouridine synthesizing protein E